MPGRHGGPPPAGSPLDIDCIVPAAGLSSRMEAHKLVSELGGQPLVRWSVENALAACRKVIVVLGHEADAVRECLPAGRHLTTVINSGYRRGMLTSIATGAALVKTPWFFVAPADMPFIPPDTYATVAAATVRAGTPPGRSGDPSPAPEPLAWFPSFRGTPGHPVLISATVIPALLAQVREEGDEPAVSMRTFLSAYTTETVEVHDEGSTIDIDTDEALHRYADRTRDAAGGFP